MGSKRSIADHEHQPSTSQFTIAGWNEVLVSVRSLEYYQSFFIDVAQWELRDQGNVSREQLDAWQLPAAASARYQLYGNPGAISGYIRLVQFAGVSADYIRIDSQSWDTGGIFDINVRVADIETAAAKMRALGWQARSPITQFTFGPFVVKEWIVQSPDGLAIALVERISPELEGWPNMRSLSRTFNATQVVADINRALKFYTEVLGFDVYLEHKGVSKAAGQNVLGLPHNITTEVPREVYILHPNAVNEGSVEILSFDGAVGSDYSARANLPNIGIAALRFPVTNIRALETHLASKQLNWVHELTRVDAANSLIIRTPEGAWLEFYEAIKPEND